MTLYRGMTNEERIAFREKQRQENCPQHDPIGFIIPPPEQPRDFVKAPNHSEMVAKLITGGKGDIKAHLWKLGTLYWKLDSLQKNIRETLLKTKDKRVCILSSRQIGKSYVSLCYAIEYAIKNPGIIVRYLAPTLKQCHDIVADNFAKIIADAPNGLIVSNKSAYRWKVGSSEIRLGALERAHVDSNRGGNAKLVIYDECGFVGSEDFQYAVESVMSAQLLRYGGREIFISSPSDNPEHYLHDAIMPECEGNGTLFRYTVYDSPSVSDDQITKIIENCGGEDTDAFKREYLAQIVRSADTLVVPSFDEGIHVKKIDPIHGAIMHYQADWGGVRDKTVFLLMAYDYFRDVVQVYDERAFDSNTPTSEVMDAMEEWEAEHHNLSRSIDCPGQLQVDLVQEYDLDFKIPNKADWQAKINQMNVHFTLGKIEIHPRCQFLIKTLKGGRFNKQKTDFERTRALGHCDALAALADGIRELPRDNPYQDAVQDAFNFSVTRHQAADDGPQIIRKFTDGFKKFGGK